MNRKRKILLELLLNECNSSSSSEESNSADSEGFSDCEEKVIEVLVKCRRPCIKLSFEDHLAVYSNTEFRKDFRISRKLFISLIAKFGKAEEFRQLMLSKEYVAKILTAFLWYSGREISSFKDIAIRFDIPSSKVYQAIKIVTKFLSNLSEQIIEWPNEEKKKETRKYFQEKVGLPSVIGIIDSIKIYFNPETELKDDFVDAKKKSFIHLQCVCDHHRRFIDICVGLPGSISEHVVLHHSPIFKELDTLCKGYCIIGDNRYPCLKYLLTPFREKRQLSTVKRNYNESLNFCFAIAEQSFSMLVRRFRKLKFCKFKDIKMMCHFIRACCVLHNLDYMEDLPEDEDEKLAELFSNENSVEEDLISNVTDSYLGIQAREKISKQMFNK